MVSTVVVGVILFGRAICSGLRRLCSGVYKPLGHANRVGFTEVEQINAYIPGVRAFAWSLFILCMVAYSSSPLVRLILVGAHE